MPFPWKPPRSRLLAALAGLAIALAVLAIALAVLAIIFRPRLRVTQANFHRIQIGMSQAELSALLGPPELQVLESGLVEGPEKYITNSSQTEEQARQRGFRDYHRQQWASSEITIIAISDPEGRVACRYSAGGRTADWLDYLRSWLPPWF
jgi:hypothetical protein